MVTSSNPPAAQNQIPNEPHLRDLLSLLKKDIMLSLNCHALGTVQSFNSANQTATATVNYKKTYYRPNLVTGGNDPFLVDYPLLVDCPVIALGGGNGALTFPIASGDECLVLFNDRDIDNWFQGSASSANATSRLHSFADGMILVGVRSMANILVDYADDAIELRTIDGLTKVSVADNAVTISANTGAGMSFALNADGTFSITNMTGEFVAALIEVLQTATAGGYPLITNLTTLSTFQEV